MSTPYIITKSPKSTGIAILLTLLFGPIGLFYSTVFGGFIMTILPIALAGISYFFILINIFNVDFDFMTWFSDSFIEFYLIVIAIPILYWVINIVWAIVGVRNYNKRIEAEAIKHPIYSI